MKWYRYIRKIVRNLGYDVVKYDHASNQIARRIKILETENINLALDVGANIGQYAQELREIGYSDKIVSFEPLSSAYKSLNINSKKDPLWETHNLALGSKKGEEEINVAGNSQSSSILEMLPLHATSAPESVYINK